MLKRFILSAVIAASVFGLSACDSSDKAGGNLSKTESVQYKEGKHYTVLSNPIKSVQEDEVLEFFWYGCPHCYSAEKEIKPWFALNKYNLNQQHSQISNSWMFDAYVFYGLKALGRDLDLGPEFFEARQNGDFSKSEDLVSWLESKQITSEQFDAAATSPETIALREMNSSIEKSISSKGVPAFIVEGKYKVEIGGLSSIGGWKGLPSLLEYLLEKDDAPSSDVPL